ncbi:MAG TPA: HAMP domain-containing sensor histidine kinase [Ktedonobacteraceae bacterium]|jgi:signal transduction histidine kinase
MTTDPSSIQGQANQSRDRFLSMITHELRSPLNAINGYLDLALSDVAGALNAQQREFVQRARAASENLFTLVENLLLVSRADAGQLHLRRQITSIQDVVINAVDEMEVTAKDREITIIVDVAESVPDIYADVERLQQVVRNLLSNALYFTPEGGRITIASFAEKEEGTKDQKLRHVVKLRVSDTGCGIAPEYHKLIFERFFQIRDRDHGRSGGQGLGLTVVKMIVELHGGRVSVQSTPEQGSTFTCTLPV